MANLQIKKIAVLGAGVMGAQIAAHCVNAGFVTLLYDLSAKDKPANAIVDKAIANLGKLKPSPLADVNTISLLQACNYKDNLDDLKTCDLVIEAIAERLDWKEDLYKKIIPYLAKDAILVTNTSGLSINKLAEVLPSKHRSHFCGVHFFNPPRYMHLVELIPAATTQEDLMDKLETWLTRYLGKGIVRAKDTPNCIANRIGVFSLLATIHHTMAMDLSLDEVDLLTGSLLGRPKSASFRTMDVVGLDTMLHVVNTMKEQLVDDPWHFLYTLPQWLKDLIADGNLGQKTGQGIYRKNGSTIEVFSLKTKSYHPLFAKISPTVKEIMKNPDPIARMQALISAKDKQAQFLAAIFRDLFHYCAYHLAAIAANVRDVDLAMRWGFGWQDGPFASWQEADIQTMINVIEEAIATKTALTSAKLPSWLTNLKAFYREEGAYSPHSQDYELPSSLAVYDRQIFKETILFAPQYQLTSIYENDGVILRHLQDDIVVLSFKSKANSIGQAVLDGLQESITIAEEQFQGLIIYQDDAANFSAGADLSAVAALIKDKRFETLAAMIADFQSLVMRLKYASVPTVAALRGRALGGGCEIILHCNAVVAAFESYPGLVELGVGLIPAGGGCKEMAYRAANNATNNSLFVNIEKYFQQIAKATVASSATEAILMDYLPASSPIIMHNGEVLYAALLKVKSLLATNYRPPLSHTFKVAGIEGHARLQLGLVNWLEGGFISQHDYDLTNELAFVLCGGDLNQNSLVDEQWMLKLEREAFIKMSQMPLTQMRIKHLLETGKPLRN